MKIQALQISYILPGVAKVHPAATKAFDLETLFERWQPVRTDWKDWLFPKTRGRKKKPPAWNPPSFSGWWLADDPTPQMRLVYQNTAMVAEAINGKTLRPVGYERLLAEWGLVNTRGVSSRSLLDKMKWRLEALGLFDVRSISENSRASYEVAGESGRTMLILRKWNHEALAGAMMVAALPVTVHIRSDLVIRRMQWLARAPSGERSRNPMARNYLFFDGVRIRRLLSLKDIPESVYEEMERQAEAVVLDRSFLFGSANHAVRYVVAKPGCDRGESQVECAEGSSATRSLKPSTPVYTGLTALPVLSGVKRLPAHFWESVSDLRLHVLDDQGPGYRDLSMLEQECDLLICRRILPGMQQFAEGRVIQELELELV